MTSKKCAFLLITFILRAFSAILSRRVVGIREGPEMVFGWFAFLCVCDRDIQCTTLGAYLPGSRAKTCLGNHHVFKGRLTSYIPLKTDVAHTSMFHIFGHQNIVLIAVDPFQIVIYIYIFKSVLSVY